MKVRLIRHGITDGNVRNAYVGVTDEPLNDIGMHMFKDVDIFTKLVYVSDKKRTKQTAKILYPKAEQVVVHDFNEMNFGDFEGKSFEDLKDNQDYVDWVESGCKNHCPNGESKREFATRCKRAFITIIESHVNENNVDDIVIVAHAGTIMSICDAFIMSEKSYFDWHIECGEHLEFNWNGMLLEER